MRAEQPIRFLIATDVHLGHSQNSQEIGHDSYEAFEEVLDIAKAKDVDFLLLGGDLFDDVNPSQKCMYKCLNLLKKNIFGDKQLAIGIQGMIPNFHNQNLNISLPIFTIHGNHDYPSNDFGKLSVCDLLHASNYVNYFGKKNSFIQNNSKTMIVTPLIFQNINNQSSSATKLAIYGLGYIKDLRLHKMLEDKQVLFEQPKDKANTVCILIVHQNRWKGKKGGVGAAYQNCILSRQFPPWIDLIIWCHEHEAITKFQIEDNHKIIQPGSTVITSYIEAESYPKQCILVTIGRQVTKKQQNLNERMNIQHITLEKSYRAMFIGSYSLDQIIQNKGGGNRDFDFEKYFDEELQKIVNQSLKKSRKKPIIRIKIDYTGCQIIRLIKVEEKFSKFIANSFKIFKYSHKNTKKRDRITEMSDMEVLQMMRKKKTPENHRQLDINAQVMELYEQQFTKHNKFAVLNFEFMKQKIDELSKYDAKSSDIKRSYDFQIQSRCKKYFDDCNEWSIHQKKQFQQIKNTLIAKKDEAQKNVINFSQLDYKAIINSHIQKYAKKEEQMKNIFIEENKDYTDSTKVIPRQRQNKMNKKGTKKSLNSNRDSIFSGQDSEQEAYAGSQEQDCCQRAEKQQYQQNVAAQNFKMAEFMIENKGPRNKKFMKDIDFK